MFCIMCGMKLPDEAKFCMKCGTNLSSYKIDFEENKKDIDVWNCKPQTDEERISYVEKIISELGISEYVIQGKGMLFLTDKFDISQNPHKQVFFISVEDSFGWGDELWGKRDSYKKAGLTLDNAVQLDAMFPQKYIENGSHLDYWLSDKADEKAFLFNKKNNDGKVIDFENHEVHDYDVIIQKRIISENEKRILVSYASKTYLFDINGKLITTIDCHINKGIIGRKYACITNSDTGDDRILNLVTGKISSYDYAFRGVAFFHKKDNIDDEIILTMYQGQFGIYNMDKDQFTPEKDDDVVNKARMAGYIEIASDKFEINAWD